MFVDLGACHIVNDVPELVAAVDGLLTDQSDAVARGNKGRDIVQSNRGALSRLLGLLEPLIGEEENA